MNRGPFALAVAALVVLTLISMAGVVFHHASDKGTSSHYPVDGDTDLVTSLTKSSSQAHAIMSDEISSKIGTALSELSKKIDRLSEMVSRDAPAPAILSEPERSVPSHMNRAVRWSKKPAFASINSPQNITKRFQKATAHICSGRDFTKSGDKKAHCFFTNLCIAPGKGDPPREYRTRGHFDWYYVYDQLPPQGHVNFTLGVGPHHVDSKIFVNPKPVSMDAFNKEFPAVRVLLPMHLVRYTHAHVGTSMFAAAFMSSSVHFPAQIQRRKFGSYAYRCDHANIQLVRYQLTHDLGYSCDYQRNPNWGDEGWVPDVITKPNRDENCKRIPSITSRPLVLMEGLFNKTKTPVCFDKLLVGTPMLSDDCLEGSHGRRLDLSSTCMTGRMDQMWAYRIFVKTHLGADDIPPRHHHVVIWQREDGKRAIKGLDALAKNIKDKFGVKVTTTNWVSLSLKEQLELIGSATIHITGPGGGSFIGFFLPRGASMIRIYASEFGMEFHFFNYLGYIHADYVKAPRGEFNQAEVLNLTQVALNRYDSFAGAHLPRNQ